MTPLRCDRAAELFSDDLEGTLDRALAADLAAHLPAELAALMVAHAAEVGEGEGWLDLMRGELTPAQAEVFRLLVIELKEGT